MTFVLVSSTDSTDSRYSLSLVTSGAFLYSSYNFVNLKASPSAYFSIAEALDESDLDAISIEDAHRPNDLKLLEIFKKTSVIMGLIDVAKSKLEEVDQITERIQECLNHIDPHRLIAAPDCGLGLLNRQLAIDKMKNLCKAAHSI